MNIAAFLLAAAAALLVFALAAARAPRATWAGVPLGLLLVTLAAIVQLTWVTHHIVKFG